MTFQKFAIVHTHQLVLSALVFAIVTTQAVAENEVSSRTALPALNAWSGDLDGMKTRRLVRILVPYSKTVYFIDKGEQFGTAVELGEELGKWLNKDKKNEIGRIKCGEEH